MSDVLGYMSYLLDWTSGKGIAPFECVENAGGSWEPGVFCEPGADEPLDVYLCYVTGGVVADIVAECSGHGSTEVSQADFLSRAKVAFDDDALTIGSDGRLVMG